jgi:dienelactone hydrolase
VPVFHALGITSLVVSYRNDGDAPRSRAGAYALGATEWRDVDAAVSWALRHGARRIVLMGWSMGGAIALQTSLGSAHREQIVGVILDSPVVDWRTVLSYQAKALHVPAPVTDLAMGALRTGWAAPAIGADGAIPLDRLDIVARAAELRHPVLILHSDDDGFVPSSASHRLADARPDLVELQVFRTARHTKLWNYDQQRWTDAIGDWLRAHDLVGAPAVDEENDDIHRLRHDPPRRSSAGGVRRRDGRRTRAAAAVRRRDLRHVSRRSVFSFAAGGQGTAHRVQPRRGSG